MRRVGWVTGGERDRALCSERRHREDVGGRVEVTLVVTAHELAVFRDGHITLDNARAHLNGGLVALGRVLWELLARTAVANREVVGFGHEARIGEA